MPQNILDILVRQEKIDKEYAERVKHEASVNNVSPAVVLVGSQAFTKEQLLEAFAEDLNLAFISNILMQPLNDAAVDRLQEEVARRHSILPLDWDEATQTITIVVQPENAVQIQLKDALKQITKARTVVFAISTQEEIKRGIDRAYRAEAELSQLSRQAKEESSEKTTDVDLKAITEIEEETAVTKVVNLILRQAITDGASDIHVEPGEHFLTVRYRIDGVLKIVRNDIPMSLASEITSRLKIMAQLDIAKKRETQDGRLNFTIDKARGLVMDMRVAVLPSIYGEKIVMRINDNTLANVELKALGFSEENYERFTSAAKKPYGMILVTGPTGSGKSTTVYAGLNMLISPEINVVTVEDPVEYRLPGITQMQIQKPLSFETALRTILRADPDVIFVGEIRDKQTAQIAIEAGLTGHLVLSTLHTNNAASTVTRLTEMGLEPFLVGSVVEAVLAQRLVRRLCNNCKERYTPEAKELIASGYWTLEQAEKETAPELCRAHEGGCEQCRGTGYRGRMAIHEVLLVDDEIESLTVKGANSQEIEQVARQKGMTTLKEDAWLKVNTHHTSIQEVLRVVA